jgi:hypothetical protein
LRPALVALALAACVDPPRQDLRDLEYDAEVPRIEREAGDAPPAFDLIPGEPTQSLHVEVHGLDSGWVQIEQEPGLLAALVGLEPAVLHLQPFDQPSFDVVAPASLHATVRIGVADEPPGPPGSAAPRSRVGESDPVKLRGRGGEVLIEAKPLDPAPQAAEGS